MSWVKTALPITVTNRWLSVTNTDADISNFFCAQRSSLDGCSIRQLIGNTLAGRCVESSCDRTTLHMRACIANGRSRRGVKMDEILMVTFHTPYDHGS